MEIRDASAALRMKEGLLARFGHADLLTIGPRGRRWPPHEMMTGAFSAPPQDPSKHAQ